MAHVLTPSEQLEFPLTAPFSALGAAAAAGAAHPAEFERRGLGYPPDVTTGRAQKPSGARRGWRETIEPGLYRAHRVACPSSADERAGRRCQCPWQAKVPGSAPGTTRTITLYGTVAEARSERRRLLAAGRPAPHVGPLTPGTLNDFAAHYLRAKAPVQSPSTIRTTAQAYRLRVSPALGHLELDEITRERIEVWLAELLNSGVSRDAVDKARKAMRVILAAAVEWGRLPSNPAAKLRLPRARPDRQLAVERVLDETGLAALLAAARNPRIETMLRAGAEAGLRRGEVIGLRWGDVDLPRRRITIERSIYQEPARAGVPLKRLVKPPKGGRSRRVAISEFFARRLADWYAIAVVEGGADASGYVWPGRGGGPMDEGTPGQALERALLAGALVDEGKRPLVTFHGLRHTAASIMLARGVPLIVVSRQLGHANPNITATIYAHLLGDEQLDLAAGAFEPAPDPRTVREPVRGTGSADAIAQQ